MGLPDNEIQELGLTAIPNGNRNFMTANGVVELSSYAAFGSLRDKGFNATVIPTPVPSIGYEILESMRLRVNPVTQQLEEVPEEEPYPPYLLVAEVQLPDSVTCMAIPNGARGR